MPNGQRVFISHSHADRVAALALAEALRAAGIGYFLDARHLHSGDRWLDALQMELFRCTAFVVLVGEQGVQRWVGAEVSAALIRHLTPAGDGPRLPIHPVLLGDTTPEALPPFLALFQAVRWDGQADPPADLIDALRAGQERLDGQARFDGCPYLGLATFQTRDAPLFFGRRAETLAALAGLGDQQQRPPEQLTGSTAAGYRRWLQIEGGSGSGKSSLVRAGLLPLVARGALWPRTGLSQWTVIGPLMPGQRPLERLAEAVELALQPDATRRDIGARRAQFMADARGLTLHLRGLKKPDAGWLLVIDQFEELFTLADEAECRAFDAAVAEALEDADAPLFLLSTVRSDFLDRIERLPRLAALYNARCQRHLLGPVSREGLREVIELAARLAGLDVSEVSTAIQQDAEGEPGALPLVENALRLLWQQRSGQRLSGQAYRQAGGLAGMLSGAADALVARTTDDVVGQFGRRHAPAVMELLLALVKHDPGGRHTRRRITRDEAVQAAGNGVAAVGEAVLKALSGQRDALRPSDAPGEVLRLVVVHPEGGTEQVDLIHETLVRSRRGTHGQPLPYWKTLADYVERHRDRDLLRQQLGMSMEPWQRAPAWARWWHLAGLGQAWAYRRLRLPPRSAAGRYVVASLRVKSGMAAVAAAVVAVSIESAVWTSANNLPLSYAFIQPLWMLGWTPVPETVPIAPPPNGRYWMGCLKGRDVAADGDCKARNPLEIDLPVAREVTLTRVCDMGKTEVTFLQYDRFIWATRGKGFSGDVYPLDQNWGRMHRPVINVRWHDAQSYVDWLNSREGRPVWRLPGEAEWEYAARGGNTGPYPWGEGEPNGNSNLVGVGIGKTLPVARYPAYGGLHDMAGNVWEWVEDKADPGEDGTEASRVLRGGSWGLSPSYLRAASRGEGRPQHRGNDLGFRVCRVSPI